MKTWVISDTHTKHHKLEIPEVDCVIHCGDFSNNVNPYENEYEARQFLEWFRALPIDIKILNCGNHDTSVSARMIDRTYFPDIIWPNHDSVVINGLNFFVSPYTPVYGDRWVFTYKRSRANIYWDAIPENTDILITHGPPKYVLDLALDNNGKGLVNTGCKTLFNKVLEVKPRMHLFGHIHDEREIFNYGKFQRWGIDFYNAACYNYDSGEMNSGHIVEI